MLGDHVVVMRGIPWSAYDALCRAREDTSAPRVAYLDGELEIMSPGRPHEFDKKLLARLVEAYGEERGLSLNGFGNETFRKKAKEAGAEPDECYCIGRAKKFPDLAIEVDRRHRGIDKLEIYRRLGVREIWFWTAEKTFEVYRLYAGKYRRRPRSRALPGLDLARVAAIVRTTNHSRQTEAVRAFRRALRRRRRG